MAIAIAMPRLGLTMEEGTVTAWAREVGEEVAKGEVVLVIETEKSEVEIEALASGVLRHVYVEVGETVPPETLLAALTETADEAFDPETFREEMDAGRGAAASPRPTASEAEASPPAGSSGTPLTGRSGRRPVATPRARRLAKELGVALERAAGTGPGGRVTEEDVRRLAEESSAGELVEAGDGVRLEVLATGNGDEVLLLPGFGSDLSVFAPQIEALSRGYRVLGLHPRGTGRSSAPDSERYTIGEGAADACAVLDHLDVDAAHVIGASLGAAVALDLALRHPERVRSLTLVTPFLAPRPLLDAVLAGWASLVAAQAPAAAAAALLPWMLSESALADSRFRSRTERGLAKMLERTVPAALERWAAGIAAWSGIDPEALAELAMPTLVLAGAQDLLAPFDEATWRTAPGVRCEILAAGHGLTLEAAEAVSSCLVEHLADV